MHVSAFISEIEREVADHHRQLEEIAYRNQVRVLKAFQHHHVHETHFNSSSGYGYGDMGRDTLEMIYAEVFGGEDALVRSQIVSGTHAISACLFAILRPGDHLLAAAGSPYDTLGRVIGRTGAACGTLIERGVVYSEAPLTAGGQPDYAALESQVTEQTRLVLIQRSPGYSLRPALDLTTIAQIVRKVRAQNPSTVIMVDNCYGEFVHPEEPLSCGADLLAGSLIKNAGGGLAVSGGYIVGKRSLVGVVADHLTAPGLGKELGASLGQNRLMYQGLFVAPHTVLQALKGAVLTAAVFAKLGWEVLPRWYEPRSDIVQAVILNTAQQVQRFCQIVQHCSPVDSDVRLEYAQMPGYIDRIIMAAGTFVQGSSIELSCDAPLRPPYAAFLQGGLTYEHIRYVVEQLVQELGLL